MDIANSLVSRSDQLNAEDLAKTGPQTYTIRKVVKGKAEQPLDFLLEETDRAWRPPVTVRRLISEAWGTTDGTVYEGRRVTLYCDPEVTFGKEKPGGIRVSHMSHLDRRFQTKIKIARGKRETFTVDPLPDAPTPPSEAAIACATDKDQLREWHRQFPTLRESIIARVAEIDAQPTEGSDQ